MKDKKKVKLIEKRYPRIKVHQDNPIGVFTYINALFMSQIENFGKPTFSGYQEFSDQWKQNYSNVDDPTYGENQCFGCHTLIRFFDEVVMPYGWSCADKIIGESRKDIIKRKVAF